MQLDRQAGGVQCDFEPAKEKASSSLLLLGSSSSVLGKHTYAYTLRLTEVSSTETDCGIDVQPLHPCSDPKPPQTPAKKAEEQSTIAI